MSDEKKDGQQGFKVSDRRKRYEEEPAAAAPAPAQTEDKPSVKHEDKPSVKLEDKPSAKHEDKPAAAEPFAHAAEAAAPAGHDGALHDEALHGEGGPIGPADFVQLVGKLYEEALVFMGYHDDPQAGASMANLPVASWHIDILGILREKTKGNLTAEEAKLVDDAVANLKVLFVRASGFLKH
jgi:hypothetical protein